MAKSIKGITIEIGGSTTGLSNALKSANSSISKTQKELGKVQKALKLDPSSTEMVKQKQELLAKQIETTKGKLEALKAAKKVADKEMKQGTEYNEEQYRELQREISNTEAQLKRLKTESRNTHGTLTTLLDNTGSALETVGGKLDKLGDKMLTVTGAAVGIGVAAGKSALDFEDSMANINTLLDDTSNLEKYETAVKELSRETGKDLSTMADGMYQAISSIGDGTDTAGIFGVMAKSAKAGGAEVTDSVSLISAGMKGYNSVNEKTAQLISDLAFQTAKLGVTTFPEMAKSMQPLFPLSSSLNLSYEELFGTMATLTGVTGNTSEVSTQLKAVFSNLIKPTESMGNLIKKYGYENGQAMIEAEGFAGVLEILKEETGGQSDKLGELFSSTEALTAVTALTGAQCDTFKDKLSQMSSVAGTTDAAYEKLETRGDSLRKAWNDTQIMAVELGETLLDLVTPTLEDVSEWADKVTVSIETMTDEEKKQIVKSAALVAALGPVLKVFGNLTSGAGTTAKAIVKITSVLGPWGTAALVAAAAIGALAVSINKELNKPLTEAKETAEKSRKSFAEFADAVDEARESKIKDFSAADEEADHLQDLREELSKLVDENGNVDESNRDRAQFIIDELNEALGTELEMEDGILANYNEQTEAIDKLIEKKRAKSKLDAAEDEYNTAITQREEAKKENAELLADLNAAKKQEEDAYKAYQEALATGDTRATGIGQEYLKYREARRIIESQYNENLGFIGSLDATANGYDDAMVAYEKGDYDKMNQLLTQQQVTFTAGGKTSISTLGEQAAEATKNMDSLRRLYEKGMGGITEEMVEEAEKTAIIATQEYQKAGGNAGIGYITGLNSKGEAIYESAESLGAKAVEGVHMTEDELQAVFERIGFEAPQSLIDAMKNKTPFTQQAVINLLAAMFETGEVNAEDLTTLFEKIGVDIPDAMIDSMTGMREDVLMEAIELFAAWKTAADNEKPGLIKKLRELGFDVATNGVGEMELVFNSTTLNAPGLDTNSWMVKTKSTVAEMQYYVNQNPITGEYRLKTVYSTPKEKSDAIISGYLAQHAAGGIFTTPHIALVAEEPAGEAIIPLSPARRQSALAILNETAALIGYSPTQYAAEMAYSHADRQAAAYPAAVPAQGGATVIEKGAIQTVIHTQSQNPDAIYNHFTRRMTREVNKVARSKGQ